jgi:hypothetical protein
MAAPGTITLTRVTPVCSTTTTTTNKMTTHGFWVAEESDFNPSKCLSYRQFVVNPNKTYALITNLRAHPVILKEGDAPFEFDEKQYRLCYKISMKEKGMALTVGERVSLTLLLNSGCINAKPFLMFPS